MTYPLTSPGVDVTFTDESAYATSGEGTIPLIIFGSHEYKVHPNGQEVALGSLPENANKIYNITSQRELIQTFGSPVFYTSGGNPLHGYELNEYGLHAAYQYLSIANRAYVIRAAIDYGQLTPKLSSPRGEPVGGTYWFDTTNTSWGLFESNGASVAGSAWSSKSVYVVNQPTDVNVFMLGTATTDDPTGTSIITASGNIIINNTPIALANNDTLQTVVTKIQSAGVSGITASVFQLSGVSRLLLINTTPNGEIIIGNTSNSQILSNLGLSSPGTYTQMPKVSLGNDGDFAVVTTHNDNIIYQKLTAGGTTSSNDPLSSPFWYIVGSNEWKSATPTRATGSNNPSLSALANKSLYISVNNDNSYAVEVNFGSTAPANIAAVVTAIQTELNAAKLLSVSDNRRVTGNNIIVTSTGNAIELVNIKGNDVYVLGSTDAMLALGLIEETRGNRMFYAPHYNYPENSVAGDVWIKTTQYDNGSLWSIKLYNATTGTWSTIGAPLYDNDASADAAFGSGKSIGTLYVRYNVYGNSSNPIASHQIRRWSGAGWEVLVYEANADSPTTDPEEGTYWYNDNFRVDIMIGDGTTWKAYRNYPGNSGTDPNGVILAGSAPTSQSSGTPLVQNDLWIDTSDLENYPKLYRFQIATRTWERVNVADQTTPFGIIFADARENSDGSVNGSENISDMLVSDFVDPDAPDPRIYPNGMLLFNTRYSTYNVKEWRPNYFLGEYQDTDFTLDGYNVGNANFTALPSAGRWVSISGKNYQGVANFGRKAQRQMIVTALAATISSNESIRAETINFNLIAAPGYVELIDEMVALNTDKKEVAFVIGDVPARLSPDGTSIQTWANPELSQTPTNSEQGIVTQNPYVAVYYPWGISTDLSGNDVMIPSSTIALVTYAYNDSVSYPWMAPAGFTRGLVTNASTVGYLNSENEFVPVFLSQGQRDTLYTNDINPIAYIPNRGLVVFGQKTRASNDTSRDRVNVSRLTNYLRFNLDWLSKPFLFEPNDIQTRDSIRIVFERFLGNLVTLRALYDYIVVCDESNNSAGSIDRNELWVDIAIKPVKAVEFIYIPVRIVNTGEDLETLYSPRSALS